MKTLHGVYLYQAAAIEGLQHLTGVPGTLAGGVCFTLGACTLAIAAAALSYHAFEARILQLKSRFAPRPALVAGAT